MQISGTLNSSTAFAYYDPRDINRDGVVSPAEVFAYSLKHPEVDNLKQARPIETTKRSIDAMHSPWELYTQKGALNPWVKTGLGSFDSYACTMALSIGQNTAPGEQSLPVTARAGRKGLEQQAPQRWGARFLGPGEDSGLVNVEMPNKLRSSR